MVAIAQTVLSFIPALNSFLQQEQPQETLGAPEFFDSPLNTIAIAEFNSDIKGSVKFSTIETGEVSVNVQLSGLPDEGGPFMYHIHEFPVPSNGDCYATGFHLNPFQGVTPCSAAASLSFCEAGDLSGKHGFITDNDFSSEYVEKFISLNPDNEAFIGGLSVTIHLADNSRIACSNIVTYTSEEDNKEELIEILHQTSKHNITKNSSNSTTSTSIGAALVNGASYGIFAAGAAGLVAALL